MRALSAICVFMLVIALAVGVPLSINHAALNAQVPVTGKAPLPIYGRGGTGLLWDNYVAPPMHPSNLSNSVADTAKKFASPISFGAMHPYTALTLEGGKLIGDTITSVYGWRRVNQTEMTYGLNVYDQAPDPLSTKINWIQNLSPPAVGYVPPNVGISEDFYGIEINASTGEGLACNI